MIIIFYLIFNIIKETFASQLYFIQNGGKTAGSGQVHVSS